MTPASLDARAPGCGCVHGKHRNPCFVVVRSGPGWAAICGCDGGPAPQERVLQTAVIVDAAETQPEVTK